MFIEFIGFNKRRIYGETEWNTMDVLCAVKPVLSSLLDTILKST